MGEPRLGLFVWAGNRKLKMENGKIRDLVVFPFSIFYFPLTP